MVFVPLVRCLQKKTALILIKAGSPHSAPSLWHWSVLGTLWTFTAEEQILETTSRLLPRQAGNSSIPANCFLLWREFNAGAWMIPYFYREHEEIPGEGYMGVTPKSFFGGGNTPQHGRKFRWCADSLQQWLSIPESHHTAQETDSEALGMAAQ